MPKTQSPISQVRLSARCGRCKERFRTHDPGAALCKRCREEAEAPPPPDNVVAILTELFMQHGTNLLNRGDRAELLVKVGLRPGQVDERAVEEAKEACLRRIHRQSAETPSRDEGELSWNLVPRQEEWPCGGAALVFETLCGRYRAYRIQSLKEEHPHYCCQFREAPGKSRTWDFVERSESKGDGYSCKRHKGMGPALEAVERFHRQRSGRPRLRSNREEVLKVLRALEHKGEEEHKEEVRRQEEAAAAAPKPPKDKKPRPPAAPREKKPRAGAPGLFGFSITKVLRAMGKMGLGFEQARKVLDHYHVGGAVIDRTVHTWLYVGRKYDDNRYGAPAELSEEQKAEILAASK